MSMSAYDIRPDKPGSVAINMLGSQTKKVRFPDGGLINSITVTKGTDGTLTVSKLTPGSVLIATFGNLALADGDLSGMFSGPLRVSPDTEIWIVSDSLASQAVVGIDYDRY